MFAGKPIATKNGVGYIIKEMGDKVYEAKIKKLPEKFSLKLEEINEEEDKNEIEYDEKELLEIDNAKKEKKAQEQQKKKKRRCANCHPRSLMLSSFGRRKQFQPE